MQRYQNEMRFAQNRINWKIYYTNIRYNWKAIELNEIWRNQQPRKITWQKKTKHKIENENKTENIKIKENYWSELFSVNGNFVMELMILMQSGSYADFIVFSLTISISYYFCLFHLLLIEYSDSNKSVCRLLLKKIQIQFSLALVFILFSRINKV